MASDFIPDNDDVEYDYNVDMSKLDKHNLSRT